MKIKSGYILRNVAGNYIVVAVAERVKEFNGIINLNETSAFLWKMLEKGATEEELVAGLLGEFDVSEDVAKEDVKKFVDSLKGANLVK